MPTKANSADVEKAKGGDGGHDSRFMPSFQDKNVRQNFIRKVYLIVSGQLTLTFLVIAIMKFSENIKTYIVSGNGTWIFWMSVLGVLTLCFTMSCVPWILRAFPINIILLFFHTAILGILLGYTCIFYHFDAILIAAGLTFFVTFSVSIFSCTTSFDFTKWAWIISIVLMVFILSGITMFFFQNKIADLIYAAIGVAIFTIYLAIDTQSIMGGKSMEISPEDYIMASMCLYMDIISIFAFIMDILNGRYN